MSYDSSNIFARILRQEIACQKIFENDQALAFKDIDPKATHHILIIPKGPYRHFHDFHQQATLEEIQGFYQAITHVINVYRLEEKGYRLITNCGQDGGQIVDHYHVHLLGGQPLGPLVSCPF